MSVSYSFVFFYSFHFFSSSYIFQPLSPQRDVYFLFFFFFVLGLEWLCVCNSRRYDEMWESAWYVQIRPLGAECLHQDIHEILIPRSLLGRELGYIVLVRICEVAKLVSWSAWTLGKGLLLNLHQHHTAGPYGVQSAVYGERPSVGWSWLFFYHGKRWAQRKDWESSYLYARSAFFNISLSGVGYGWLPKEASTSNNGVNNLYHGTLT